MALSDNAIGFFLEVEDVSLSRTLGSATKAYEDYTKALEQYNKQAFDSASRGLGQIQKLVAAVEELPTAAAKSMKRASATIEKQIKPITQKVNLTISAGSATRLQKIIGKAVSDAMTGANVRLTASLPQRRMAMFQQGVGLRAQYQDIPQPPDMRGKIQPLKKYAKGGVVEGPPGLDKVFAMLTKGEMVLPADVTEKLASAGGRALKTGEIDPKDVKELIDLTATYGDELGDVNKQFKFVGENLDNLTDITKLRLGGAMLQAVKRTKELEEVSDGAGNKLKRLLVDILGPAKFLAIAKGIDELREGIGSLRAGAGAAFSTLGGDEIGSFLDEIGPVNKALQLSRDEFRKFRLEYAAAAAEAGAELNASGAAATALVDAGVRGKDQLMRLGPLITNMAVATKTSMDKLGESAFLLEGAYQLSTDQIAALFNDMRKFGATSAIETSVLFEGLTDNLRGMSDVLMQQTEQDQLLILSNQARLSAALSDNWQDSGNKISGIITDALSGDQDAIVKAQKLFRKTPDELLDAFKSGDLSSVMAPLQEQIRSLSGNQLGLSELARVLEFPGTPQELALLGKRTEEFNASLASLGAQQHTVASMAQAQDELTAAADAQLTAFDRLRDGFNKWVVEIGGGEVIDFFKEFNATSLLSIAVLGKPFLGALGKAAGRLKSFGGWAATGLRSMASMGGMFSKLGPLLGKIALSAGPLLLVAGAAAFVGKTIIDLSNDIEAANAISEKGEKAALTDFGAIGADIMRVKKNIKRVQSQVDIDEAAGKEANPAAIRLLERYNDQLATLEMRSKGMVDAAKGRKAVGLAPDLTADPMAGMNMPTDPMAGMNMPTDPMAGMNMPTDFAFDPSTFQPPVSPVTAEEMAAIMPTPESNEKQEKLMERMVALMEEQVRVTRQGNTAASPSPSVQGPSTGVSSFGRMVAGGEL